MTSSPNPRAQAGAFVAPLRHHQRRGAKKLLSATAVTCGAVGMALLISGGAHLMGPPTEYPRPGGATEARRVGIALRSTLRKAWSSGNWEAVREAVAREGRAHPSLVIRLVQRDAPVGSKDGPLINLGNQDAWRDDQIMVCNDTQAGAGRLRFLYVPLVLEPGRRVAIEVVEKLNASERDVVSVAPAAPGPGGIWH